MIRGILRNPRNGCFFFSNGFWVRSYFQTKPDVSIGFERFTGHHLAGSPLAVLKVEQSAQDFVSISSFPWWIYWFPIHFEGMNPGNTNQQAAWNPPRSGPNDGDWGYSTSLFQLCLQCQRSGWKVHGQGVDGMGWKIHGTELYQFSQVKFTVNSTTNNTTHIDVHSEQFGEQKPTKKNLPSGFARSFTKLCRDCGLYVTQIYSDDWGTAIQPWQIRHGKGQSPPFQRKNHWDMDMRIKNILLAGLSSGGCAKYFKLLWVGSQLILGVKSHRKAIFCPAKWPSDLAPRIGTLVPPTPISSLRVLCPRCASGCPIPATKTDLQWPELLIFMLTWLARGREEFPSWNLRRPGKRWTRWNLRIWTCWNGRHQEL